MSERPACLPGRHHRAATRYEARLHNLAHDRPILLEEFDLGHPLDTGQPPVLRFATFSRSRPEGVDAQTASVVRLRAWLETKTTDLPSTPSSSIDT